MSTRLYALLLYLYPNAFRREYGEAMLQLFQDQRRGVRGVGGYAMLWLKTLRDLVLSVPAAHSNAPRSSKPTVLLWTIVILGLVFVMNAVVLPSAVSRMPSAGEVAPVVTGELVPAGQYRGVAQVAVALIGTVLAFGALVFAQRRRNVLNGVAGFIVGAAITFVALAMNPWIWLPLTEYPIGVAWALGVWPLSFIVWIALRVAARARPVA
jgi:hypothetical protein